MWVILSTQRAGTHMLQSLLNSHPTLHGYGEVLLEENEHEIPTGRYEGCIMQYNQVRDKRGKKANALKALRDRDNKIIHLTRNIEDNAYSRIVMNKYKGLTSLCGKVRKVEAAPVAKEEIRKTIRLIQDQRKIVLGQINRDDLFEITYEQITGGNKEARMLSEEKATPMLEYLGVGPIELSTKWRKIVYINKRIV